MSKVPQGRGKKKHQKAQTTTKKSYNPFNIYHGFVLKLQQNF